MVVICQRLADNNNYIKKQQEIQGRPGKILRRKRKKKKKKILRTPRKKEKKNPKNTKKKL